MYVASFANAISISTIIRELNYDRVFICCGGFYDSPSLEDEIVGGQILHELRLPMEKFDDTARIMLTVYRAYDTLEKQYEITRTNWIGSSLSTFDRQDDIKTVLWGEGINSATWARMQALVLSVQWIGDQPVIQNNSQ